MGLLSIAVAPTVVAALGLGVLSISPATAAESRSETRDTANVTNQVDSPRHQLRSGEQLQAGEGLVSPNGLFRLDFQDDGQLVLRGVDGREIRRAGDTHGDERLEMAQDGNLQTVSDEAGVGWSSATSEFRSASTGPLMLELTDAGVATIRGSDSGEVVWRNGESVVRPHSFRMNEGDTLRVGESLVSYEGKYRLTFTREAQLVLASPTRTVWSTSKFGQARTARFTGNDFVIRDPESGATWRAGTSGFASEATGSLYLQLTDFGYAEIRGSRNHDILWENGLLFVGDRLDPGQTLRIGEALESKPNGILRLYLDEHRLRLRSRDVLVWQTDVLRSPDHLAMDRDNNLRVWTKRSGMVWKSNTETLATPATGDLYALITEDGRLQLRGSKNDVVVWENGRPV